MLTKKHLKQIGFTFISKRTAYYDSPVGKVAIIGGFLSFIDTKKVHWLEDMGYWRLVSLLAPPEPKPAVRPPSIDAKGAYNFFISSAIAPVPVMCDQVYSIATNFINLHDMLPITDQLEQAGFTPEQITLCNQRFKESGFTDYDSWCTAYIALNSTEKVEGVPLDGNLVINSILNSNKKPKRFSLGSYKR